jgi:VanZ family protein
MSRAQPSLVLTSLLLVVIALICYGSLYPFNFKYDGSHDTILGALRQLSWARAGRADRVSNVLLYIPLGFCCLLWLRSRVRGPWLAAGIATVTGTLLSLCIEVAQVYISVRVPSLMDVSLNALGTLIGAIGGVGWRALSTMVRLPSSHLELSADRSAFLVLLLWLAWRLTPFEPHVNLVKLKLALQPLLHPEFNGSLTLRYLVLWLVIAQAVISLVTRQRSIEVLLGVMVIVLAGRLLFVTPAFIPSELLALVVLLPVLVGLHRFRSMPQNFIVVAAFALLFVLDRWQSVDFGQVKAGFDLWPFLPWIADGMPIELEVLLRKLFFFGALTWLLKDAGLDTKLAVIGVAAAVLVLEIVKVWAPGGGSLTDPALAFATAMMFHYASANGRRRTRLRAKR